MLVRGTAAYHDRAGAEMKTVRMPAFLARLWTQSWSSASASDAGRTDERTAVEREQYSERSERVRASLGEVGKPSSSSGVGVRKWCATRSRRSEKVERTGVPVRRRTRTCAGRSKV